MKKQVFLYLINYMFIIIIILIKLVDLYKIKTKIYIITYI